MHHIMSKSCILLLPQVIEPRVKAWLYTWGEGRVTAEGEHIQGEPRWPLLSLPPLPAGPLALWGPNTQNAASACCLILA
jgi:hypothetical protein